jgi:CMP-N-acetylneuraminic acid synthetase
MIHRLLAVTSTFKKDTLHFPASGDDPRVLELDGIAAQLMDSGIWNDSASIMDLFDALSNIRITDKLLKRSRIAEAVWQFSNHPSKTLRRATRMMYFHWGTVVKGTRYSQSEEPQDIRLQQLGILSEKLLAVQFEDVSLIMQLLDVLSNIRATPELLKASSIDEVVQRFRRHRRKAVRMMVRQLTEYWKWVIHTADDISTTEQESQADAQSRTKSKGNCIGFITL